MTAVALSALCLTLAGCGNKQSVLFVTATTIGIDADTTPPHATIGYDRYEGYIGPSYSTGALPPVVAKIESDLKIFNPEIRQLYATGDAARLVTKEKLEEGDPKKDGEMYTGSGRLTLFGTGTNIGLRVTWAGNVPESISFGYKRKEFSYIPLGSEPIDPEDPKSQKVDRYGSALAAIDMGVHTESITTTGMAVTQFFATGDAAKNLAVREPIRKRFLLEAEQSVRATSCNYGPDENTDKLDAAAEAQPNFHEKLTAWLAREGIDTDPATFTICDLFADARAKAVQDTALMNQ
jgi:hypothetical protein